MDKDNILSEGILDKLFKFLKLDKSEQDKVKKDRKLKNVISDFNNAQKKLEKSLHKYTGEKVKLTRY
tara:strand:+ start:1283 stop:1483 length:201 start_codon:yes stop_codon:yes gene_type:complete